MKKLVILGAHTAVGRALVDALDDRGLKAEVLRTSTTDQIEPDLDLLDARAVEGASLFFLAADGEVYRRLAEGASQLKAPVVDLIGAVKSAPLVFPVLDRDRASSLSGVVRVPLGLVGGVVSVLRALEPFRPTSARVVTFEGAAAEGKPGIEELSRQTRAVFTGQDAAPEVFYAPVAFAVLTSVEAEDDPFGPDLRFAADVQAGLAEDALELRVTRTRVPVFTGEGAALDIELEDPPPEETLLDVLSEARGLRLAKGRAPSTLEVVDRDDAIIGRVRLEGRRLDLFVLADRLRGGAASSAALLAEAVLADERSS